MQPPRPLTRCSAKYDLLEGFTPEQIADLRTHNRSITVTTVDKKINDIVENLNLGENNMNPTNSYPAYNHWYGAALDNERYAVDPQTVLDAAYQKSFALGRSYAKALRKGLPNAQELLREFAEAFERNRLLSQQFAPLRGRLKYNIKDGER